MAKRTPTPTEQPQEEALLLTPEAPGPETESPAAAARARSMAYVLGGIMAAVLLLAVGYFFYRDYQADQNAEAQKQMIGAVRFFERDSTDKALNGTSQNPGLLTLADEYSGTDAGNLAQYYAGIALLRKGKTAEGIEALEAFKKKDNMASAMAYSALGYAHEELKDFAKAADYYIKASEVQPNSQTTPYFLAQAARTLEYANEPGKALGLYERLERMYPDSPEGQQAAKHIARLGGGA